MKFADLNWCSLNVKNIRVECMARVQGVWTTVAMLVLTAPYRYTTYTKAREYFEFLQEAMGDWEVQISVEDGALKIIAMP